MKVSKIFNKKKGVFEYQARFQLGNKEFRPKAASRKILLETIDEIRARAHRRRFELPVETGSPRLKVLFEKRLASISNSQSLNIAKNAFDTLTGILGSDFRVKDLKTSHLHSFIEYRTGTGKVQPQTANREMTAIASALHSAALYFSELETWICPKIPRAKVLTGRRERLITKSEIDVLLEYLRRNRGQSEEDKNYYHRLRLAHSFEFAGLTGLRRKEIATLKFSDYDRSNNSLRVVRWKTNTVTQFAPLPRRAVEIIDERRSLQTGAPFIFTPNGAPVHSDYRTLKNVCKRLELDYGQTTSGFTAHDLRHGFITNLVARGVDIETVKTFSGHSDSKTLLRYTHSSAEQKKRAIDLIDGRHLTSEWTELYHEVKSGKLSLGEFLLKMSLFR